LGVGTEEQEENLPITSQKIEFSQDDEIIENIKIEIGYSKLTMKAGNELKVETKNREKTVEVKKSGNTLQIKDRKIWNLISLNQEEQHEIIITIPNHTFLNKVKIEAGNGEIVISDIQMDTLDFEMGAGNIHISHMVVENKTNMDGGAGKVVIQDSILNNLDLDVGVGEFQIQNTTILGNSDIDAGIGKLEVKIKGNAEDYRIVGNRGLGSFTIENKEIEDNKIYGDGENKVKIDAGVGKVEVDFIK